MFFVSLTCADKTTILRRLHTIIDNQLLVPDVFGRQTSQRVDFKSSYDAHLKTFGFDRVNRQRETKIDMAFISIGNNVIYFSTDIVSLKVILVTHVRVGTLVYFYFLKKC